jgi:butyrate response factor 1
MQFVAGTFMAFAYSSRTPNSAPKSTDADKRLSLSDSASQQPQQMQQQQPGANSGHYKCEMCRSWSETGTCRYGPRCQFAHGAEELRPRQRGRNYKTKACRSWEETGACPYGKRCQFLHDGYENVDGINVVETAAAFDSHATSRATGGDSYDSHSQQHQHQHKSASSDLPPRSSTGPAGSGGQSESAGPSGRRRFMSSPPEMQESAVAATTAASASGYAETHRAHRGSAPAVMAYANMAKQPPPPSSQHHHQPQQQQNHHQHHQQPPQEQYYAHAPQHPHHNQYHHHHSGNGGGSDHRGSFQQQPQQQQHYQQPHRLNPTEELLSALLTSGAFPALQDLAIALQHVAASNSNTNMNVNVNGRSSSVGADDSVDSFGADSLNAVSTSSASQSLLLSPQSPLMHAQTGPGSSIGRAAANVRATSSGSLSSWPSSPMHASSGFSAGAGRGSIGISTSSDSPYPNSSPNLVSTMPHTTAPSSPHSFDASSGGSFSSGFGSGLGQAMMHPQQHGAHATSSFGAPHHRSQSVSLLGGGGGGSVGGHTHAPGEVAYSFQQGQQLGMNPSHQQHSHQQQQGQQQQQSQQHYQPPHHQSSHFAPSSQLGFSGSIFDSALFLNHDGGAQSTAPTSYFAVAGDSVHDSEAASRPRLPVFQHLDANDAAASSNASAHSHATRSF